MEFTELLSACRGKDATPEIPPGWGQGRATFGGLVAAMLYEQLAARVDPASTLRSITFSFVAPVGAGKTSLTSEVLRAGRSVTQVEGRMQQNGAPVLAALASFGSGRDSAVHVAADTAPHFMPPGELQPLPYIEGLVPEFTQRFDYRISVGDMPFSGSASNRFGGWVRFRGEEEGKVPVTIGHLLALVDAWPPAILPMLKQPAPASSLTWTLEFMEPLPSAGCGEWWQYLADVEQAEDGYGVAQARLWGPQGQPVAFSRQTVTVFG
ncbi:acyl-CoA thioesterase [Microbulbifer yueqingensis]|uniref:Acyl-CoA thioesterase n=1 Tax=Microbulbifer yueqingensis TaxID=658219 RepID=A0A1G8XG93_9GAMM|nr:thioesterase family protein [Microbulbifer yueqingensis]SDJ89501.1 Acyl-CoA thioesterase [Microbulbifer yueqingensis]